MGRFSGSTYRSGLIASVVDPNLPTIFGAVCEFAKHGQQYGTTYRMRWPVKLKALEVEDPKLLGGGCGSVPMGCWNLGLWRSARVVLVGRVVATGCRRKKALCGTEKGLEQSDRQCSRWWWHFLEELSLHVNDPRRRRFRQSMTRSRRKFGSKPICIKVPFSGYALSFVSFHIRQYGSTAKENSKPSYKHVFFSADECNGPEYQANNRKVSHRTFRQLQFCLGDRKIHQEEGKNRHEQMPIATEQLRNHFEGRCLSALRLLW